MASMAESWDAARVAIGERLDLMISRIAEAQDAGEPVSISWLNSEARYRSLLDQIDVQMASLTEAQAGALAQAQAEGIDLSVQAAMDLTSAALGPAPEDAIVRWNQLPVATVEALAGYASDGSPLAQLLDEFGLDVSRQIKNTLIAGVARGAGAEQIAREIRGLVGADENPGSLKNRALTIVRTEFHRAARAAHQQSYQQNADLFEGWIWSAACDSRCCISCWAMHGSLHPLTATLDDHPSGRCVMVPRTRSWAELTGDGEAEDTRPTIVDGPSRFAKLSPEQQVAIMGPGIHELYAAGQVDLAGMVAQEESSRWGTMRRPATLASITADL